MKLKKDEFIELISKYKANYTEAQLEKILKLNDCVVNHLLETNKITKLSENIIDYLLKLQDDRIISDIFDVIDEKLTKQQVEMYLKFLSNKQILALDTPHKLSVIRLSSDYDEPSQFDKLLHIISSDSSNIDVIIESGLSKYALKFEKILTDFFAKKHEQKYAYLQGIVRDRYISDSAINDIYRLVSDEDFTFASLDEFEFAINYIINANLLGNKVNFNILSNSNLIKYGRYTEIVRDFGMYNGDSGLINILTNPLLMKTKFYVPLIKKINTSDDLKSEKIIDIVNSLDFMHEYSFEVVDNIDYYVNNYSKELVEILKITWLRKLPNYLNYIKEFILSDCKIVLNLLNKISKFDKSLKIKAIDMYISLKTNEVNHDTLLAKEIYKYILKLSEFEQNIKDKIDSKRLSRVLAEKSDLESMKEVLLNLPDDITPDIYVNVKNRKPKNI